MTAVRPNPGAKNTAAKAKAEPTTAEGVEQGGELPADMCWTKKLIVVVM